MSRKPDIAHVKAVALGRLAMTLGRYDEVWHDQAKYSYLLRRWMASMTAVEIYATWERYAERRLTVALVYKPQKFIVDNNIRGLQSISLGLAAVLVRGGNRYFDIRSVGDLIDRGDRFLERNDNPFRKIPTHSRKYLDTLGAIRNCVVHQSENALAAYKKYLSEIYAIKSKPEPDEFSDAIDYRPASPSRYKPRILGLAKIVQDTINLT